MKNKSIDINLDNHEYILNQLDEIVLILNRERRVFYHNDAINKLSLKSSDSIIGLRPGNIFNCIHIHENQNDCGTTEFCKHCGANQAIIETLSKVSNIKECAITSMVGNRGTVYNLKVSSSPIFIDEEQMVLFILTDISKVKKGRILESTLHDLFQNMNSGVAIYEETDGGKDFIFQFFNTAAEKIDHISQDDVIGKRLTEAFPGVVEMGLLDALRAVHKTGEAISFPMKFYTDNSISGWRDNYIFKLPMGEIVAIYDDVTEQKKLESELKKLSITDELTGLKNRRSLECDLAQMIRHANENNLPLAVLMIDIDYFKNYNDNHGHLQGDECLKKVSGIIRNSSGEAYRFGGEEFVLLLPDTDYEAAFKTAEELRNSIMDKRMVHGNSITSKYVTISLGLGIKFAENEVFADELLATADKQLYLAKYSGRNCTK